MVTLEMKAHILANIIIQKNKDIEKVDIPNDCKVDVYKHVGYARILSGEIYEGITILRKSDALGGEDFMDSVVKIAFEKIREKRILEGAKIIKVLEALGYQPDYTRFINPDTLVDIAKLMLKDSRIEEAFSLLSLVFRMGNRAFIPMTTEVALEKISTDDIDIGILMLRRLQELVGDDALQYLGDYIYNRLKAGEVEFGIELLRRLMPLAGKKYFAHALDIGYQKIAKGEVEVGMEIVQGIKQLGGDVDENILNIMKEET